MQARPRVIATLAPGPCLCSCAFCALCTVICIYEKGGGRNVWVYTPVLWNHPSPPPSPKKHTRTLSHTLSHTHPPLDKQTTGDPSGLTQGLGVKAVSAGGIHSAAVDMQGALIGWLVGWLVCITEMCRCV